MFYNIFMSIFPEVRMPLMGAVTHNTVKLLLQCGVIKCITLTLYTDACNDLVVVSANLRIQNFTAVSFKMKSLNLCVVLS